MNIAIDLTLEAPPYEQIRRDIAAAIRRGDLRPGERLPTVRQLGRDLGLSPATIGHAYRELERTRVIHTAGRKGTFVAPLSTSPAASLHELAEEFVRRASELGVDRSSILHAVVDALED